MNGEKEKDRFIILKENEKDKGRYNLSREIERERGREVEIERVKSITVLI